jgi:hypothetical protein
MPKRLTPLTDKELDAARASLIDIEAQLKGLTDLLGPAYGAEWTNRLLKASRSIWIMHTRLRDRAF